MRGSRVATTTERQRAERCRYTMLEMVSAHRLHGLLRGEGHGLWFRIGGRGPPGLHGAGWVSHGAREKIFLKQH